ncbi:MAG: PEP-CTERM sorting domain-containing protein [Burkholderiales bacterium]|nr:PEP-CTERM sorting domain-containing protein [Burkholderiales bacterium]
MHAKTKLLTVVLAACLAPAANASTSIDLTQADFSTWSLHGFAAYGNNGVSGGMQHHLLRLTTHGTGGSAGAAFAPSSALINFNQPFTVNFNFFMVPGVELQGDGMTFVMTGTNPTADPVFSTPGMDMGGSGGSGLGYGGTSPGSYAFAIDTFHFSGQPVSPSIQILKDGSVTPIAFTETGVGDIRDPGFFQWQGQVAYAPSGNNDETGMLTGTINQFVGSLSFSVSAPVDWTGVSAPQFDAGSGNYLGRAVFIGFTAGNGLADDGHFVSSVTPVPEAETWAMLLAGLGVVGWSARPRVRSA